MNNIVIPQTNWDASLYQEKHGFVWQYGEDLLQLLQPQTGEKILDLGCGTGQLTEKIAQSGAEVIGIDNADSMIVRARDNFSSLPNLRFEVADARNFHSLFLQESLDAVFSNAALHWVKEADAVINNIYKALKIGGRFVAEFGGKGNIQAITHALYKALGEIGIDNASALNPWYYPSIAEYSSLLEAYGFEVQYAILFSRPTPLTDGDAGMANWIKMFASSFLNQLDNDEKIQVIQGVEEQLKPALYKSGTWTADYRRIRIFAIRNNQLNTYV